MGTGEGAAKRRAQRASECRVGSAQRKNNVTYAADNTILGFLGSSSSVVDI